MTDTGVDPELAEVADRVLGLVGDAGPSGELEASVTVGRTRSGLTRFANSFIHQNVGDDSTTVILELVVAGRPATASTNRTDPDSLRQLVHATREAAAVRPVDPDWPGLGPPTSPVAPPDLHYDQPTADAGPDQRADVVADFVAAGAGLTAAGYCETTVVESVFANSTGHRLGGRATTAVIDGIHRDGRSDGCGSMCSTRLSDLDGSAAGARAADRARRGSDAVELEPGRYEVVLEPRCVAYMVDFLAVYGFNARAVKEGRSFANPGEAQLDASLNLWDDAADPRHTGLGFDSEGTPKRRLALVDAGVTTGLTHDRRTAAKAGPGALSTGHAVPGGESFGAVAGNVFLSGAGGGRPVDELVSAVGRGLLVSDFWYARVLDPKTLVVTGLTRNGVFLIEDGRVGPAVSNLRFTQSPVAAFGPGRVLGVGDDAVLAPGGLHFAWHHAPSLHLAQWHFTGNASG